MRREQIHDGGSPAFSSYKLAQKYKERERQINSPGIDVSCVTEKMSVSLLELMVKGESEGNFWVTYQTYIK